MSGGDPARRPLILDPRDLEFRGDRLYCKRPGQEPTRHISHQPNNKRSPDPPPIRTLDKLTEVESG